jgi:isopenicillin N synthase-like dioxygenase
MPPNGRPSDGTAINGDAFLATAAGLFTASDAIFGLPVSEKQKFDYAAQGSYFGYKGYGSATIAGGRKDRNEFFNIAKDDVLEQAQGLVYPAVLDQFRPELQKFMTTSHAIACLILNRLDTCLGLREGTLANLHRLSAISGDQVRWVSAEPQPAQDRTTALGAHTDYGSVTVLFNRLGGLQVLQPGAEYTSLEAVDEKYWLYVRPLPGHCIVNLGDAMVKFTSGVVRSNVHRVVNPPGDQQTWKRTSLVYFARPEDEVLLVPIEGSKVVDEKREELRRQGKDEKVELITSKDWILRRALGPRGYGDITKAGGTEATSAKAIAAQ